MGIVVLDFGGQYAHLIANRIRRLHVWAEIRPPDTPFEELARADGLILSGGPSSVYAEDRPPFEEALLSSGKPILGLCYGHQLLCHALGGRVERGERMEYGAASLEVTAATGVLAGLNPREPIWMSHRDLVEEIPPGFQILGRTGDCPVAAMGDDSRRIYGLQFHPEVTHTESGMRILDNFLDLCGCERDWTMEGFIDRSMEGLERQARGRKLFLLVSGGVDSTVCFLLLNRALGTDRVLGLHIDNGFMRKGETAAVESLLKGSGFSNLKVVDASAAFLDRVAGVADPEAKRLAIGEEFIEVRDRVLAELDLDPDQWLLGQGTLYTDTIESGGTDHAEVIKTHHNRVGVIERLLAEGKVVEPLSQLYKDEVRELGEKLGVPHHLVWRHPFPGPGLAVRCLCAGPGAGHDAAEPLGTLDGSNLDAELLPLRSVGVQGDGRTYAHPALLTAAGAAILPGERGRALLGRPGARLHGADQLHRPRQPRPLPAGAGAAPVAEPAGGLPHGAAPGPAARGRRHRHGGPGPPRPHAPADADAHGAGTPLLRRGQREHRPAAGDHRGLHDRPLRPAAGGLPARGHGAAAGAGGGGGGLLRRHPQAAGHGGVGVIRHGLGPASGSVCVMLVQWLGSAGNLSGLLNPSRGGHRSSPLLA